MKHLGIPYIDCHQTGTIIHTGFYKWGCYSENFNHLWNLDDVAESLKGEYETRGLLW